jgi:hypothetical protein
MTATEFARRQVRTGSVIAQQRRTLGSRPTSRCSRRPPVARAGGARRAGLKRPRLSASVSQKMLQDQDIRVETGRGRAGGTFVRVVHVPTGRTRTQDRLGLEAHADVVARLRAELDAELTALGWGDKRGTR